ncbi:DUF1190 domain-containing protein [Salinarimonas soli]|uniref:DUF1190 domain-containing protein n=1 Tax=Salinarimonas soli TaxID=1638099 RepID=A0A5B2VX83_9HYPH|nr:DUF1190 domain-containing protein [Salinarimonas soli]KAA2243941.1 DUF1190 domain-containing protein [Salinarimonas soli]
MKRSRVVSLVMLAGVGATAWALGRVDPSQREDEVVTYGSDAECARMGQRSAEDCRAGLAQAKAEHARTAPRYEALSDCETQHGRGRCESGAGVGAGSYFIPTMVGYMMARNLAQGLGARPLYGAGLAPPPREEQASGGGGGGGGSASRGMSSGGTYRTSSGTIVRSPGAAGVTRVPVSEVRSMPSRPQIVSRGGFGSTGRAVATSSGT